MKLRNKVATALAVLGAVAGTYAQNNITFKNNLTGIEAKMSDEGKVGSRLNLIGTIQYGDAIAQYGSRHNINDLSDANTYLGVNNFNAGDKDWFVRPAAMLITKKDGVVDAKAGFTSNKLVKALGGKGAFQVTADDQGIHNITLATYDLGNNWYFDLTNVAQFPYGQKASNYNELQLSKNIGKNLQVFARSETTINKAGVDVGGSTGLYFKF